MNLEFETRRANPMDADHIAMAHRDSIQSIGSLFYPPTVVADWGARLSPDLYVRAMERGEVFFVALGALNGAPAVLGFSTHRVEMKDHRTAVYVRGAAIRRGIGTALFRLAEADAIASGATRIQVDASLAAVDFYKANGFEEIGRGASITFDLDPPWLACSCARCCRRPRIVAASQAATAGDELRTRWTSGAPLMIDWVRKDDLRRQPADVSHLH